MIRSLIILVVASGCTLLRPVDVAPPPAPKSFVAEREITTPPDASGSEAATPVDRVTKQPVWWSAFADPALDATIQETLHNNYFLRDVRTLIRENGLDPNVPWTWWWPLQIGIPAGQAGIQTVELGSAPIPESQGGTDKASQLQYNSINVGLTASYQVDLWGNLDARRRVGQNLVDQQRQSSEIAAQNLAEQVAQLWFDILVNRALKELTEGEVKYNEDLFDLTKARFDQHLGTRLVVLQQEQQLLNIRSQVPLISARIAMLNSQLTALMGRTPSPRDRLIPLERKLPDVLPALPALGTPDDLNKTTPEMRFAKLRVTEIEHRVNQNLSSWLPVIELVGSAGVISFEFGKPIRESFAGVRLSWPIFDGGRRMLESDQFKLTLRRRVWQYELAIKTQIGRVQDALLQEQAQAESLQSLRGQIELGHRVLDEARRLFVEGQSDYLPVLSALSSLASLERDGLRAQRLLLSYRVQLYRALGGNWSFDATELTN